MSSHIWRFFRAGAVDQAQLTRGADLVALGSLDQKLWLALACPVKGVEFDARTLELIDADNDRRVRANELIAACEWAGRMLADVEELVRPGGDLRLAAIDTSKPESEVIHRTAKALLHSLGKDDATAISVDDAAAAVERFNAQPFNGDGILPPETIDDEALRSIAADALACTPEPATDRSGKPGLTADHAKAFFDAVLARVAWLDRGAEDAVRALGDDTDATWAAIQAVRSKIDDYFGRVRLAAFDSRALDAINREQSEYLAIAAQDLHICADEVEHFPLARVQGDQPLPLGKGLNPAWLARMDTFRERVVVPLLGERDVLTDAEWASIVARFGAFTAWQAQNEGAAVASLPPERLREIAASDALPLLLAAIEEDASHEDEAKAIESVERLARYRRDLLRLANNFVSFKDFYGRRDPAIFQVGTLYIDRRACSLCVDVTDAARHASLAAHSNAYLLYCDLKNAKGETRQIVAAMTNGDVRNLMVGRNGLFYDTKGVDWDATVSRIVDNPISLRQAFWAPYFKFLRMIEDQVARRAAAAEERSDARLTETATRTDAAMDGTPAAAPPRQPTGSPRKVDVGVVAALGVAVGGLVTALGLILQAFFGLGLWMPVGLIALMLLISAPSVAVAWLKLRTRNLGPLLDANGWAVNALARVNVPLGESLTSVAELPKDAERDLVDPFADKKRPWPIYAAIALLFGGGILWYLGLLDGLLPERFTSRHLLGDVAPAVMIEEAQAAAEAAEAEAAAEAADDAPADDAPADEAPVE